MEKVYVVYFESVVDGSKTEQNLNIFCDKEKAIEKLNSIYQSDKYYNPDEWDDTFSFDREIEYDDKKRVVSFSIFKYGYYAHHHTDCYIIESIMEE